MAKLSIAQLNSAMATYVASNKMGQTSFTASTDNTAGLLDKIGKVFTIDTDFNDPLKMFEGDDLSYGKTIEEWYEDLILPQTQDTTGANTLAPHDPDYRPNTYSYSLGKQTIPTTIRNNDLQRAVHNEGQLAELLTMKMKRLNDSEQAMKYSLKKQMINNLIGKIDASYSTSATTFASTGTYAEGTLLKDNNNPTEWGIIVKAYSNGNATSWADAKAKGYIIKYTIKEVLAKPIDTTTGEAFVKAVKSCLETASFYSEGNSLNGNTIGAVPNMVLLIQKGIMPSIEVDVMAGAFNAEKVTLPAEVKVVDNFGSYSGNCYALLVDRRILRLHNDYREVMAQVNAEGGFVNYFQNTEWTAHISRNAFVHAFYSA